MHVMSNEPIRDTFLFVTYSNYPSGLRKTKTTALAISNYIWDGSNMICEYANSAASGKVYIYGQTLISQGNSWYYLYNARGDVVKYITANGAVLKSYDYDAFGEEADPSTTDTNPFRYAGQYFDDETGTYYLRARYYNPGNGRFTQQDSWGYADPEDPLSLNLYVYCKNNPVAYVDLNGNFAITATVLLILGGGLLSAGIDFGVQMWQNGGDLSSVDVKSMVASGVSGMVTTALGPWAIGTTLGTTILGGSLLGGIGYGTYHIVNGTETTLLGWINSMAWGGFWGGIEYKIVNKNSTGFPDFAPRSPQQIAWDQAQDKIPSPVGLIGKDFEDYLTQYIGGSGSFHAGGLEFDGRVGNRWWEAKSGQYWNMLLNNPKKAENFRTSMGHHRRVAFDNGATFEIFSNTPIPEYFKEWLTQKGIPYTEFLS